MNWGNKLILVFIAFGAFIGTMVYKCMQSPVSLVSKEYYKDELNYQQVIDADKSAAKLSTGVQLALQGNTLKLQLPQEMQGLDTQGNVWFYCANDSRNDRKFKLDTHDGNSQDFTLETFRKGSYVVKIDWEAQGTNYYAEKQLIIP